LVAHALLIRAFFQPQPDARKKLQKKGKRVLS